MTSFMASSTSSDRRWTYDVFLSFRGEDTRNNFIAHLYAALRRTGFYTYIDDDLKRGENISPALFKAIEVSRVSIIILSKNYVSSSWCLDELTKILECNETKGQIVLPVFYKVDPSDVRHQRKSFGEAFTKYEETFKNDRMKVQRWKTALAQVANLSGWHLFGGNESRLVDAIVEEILIRLCRPRLVVAKRLVGLESRLMDINLHLNLEMNDTRMIGIFGMGGIGKTTLAKAVYNSIAHQFQGSCFLFNIREISSQPNGLVRLQEQLLYDTLPFSSFKVGSVEQGITLIKQRLSSKRVLLILDDVDQLFQLEALAGECDWFGLGSRIIIATRDRSLLTQHRVDRNYRMGELDHNEALQLFSLHAFRKEKPNEDYVELAEHAIHYAGGLPLTLQVLGSLLFGRSRVEWRAVLDKLKRFPDHNILKILRTSYDGLNDTEKDIFLDIACFFKGERVTYVINILEGCDFFPVIGIQRLMDKSLIGIDERNTLMMHDLLQDMGREIVRQESPTDPSKRSRLWYHNDVQALFEYGRGGSNIEGILVDLPEKDLEICLKSSAFEKMTRLRLFINRNARISGQLNSLPNELRLIDWPCYSSQSLPSNFNGKKVIVFEMRNALLKKIDKFKNFKEIRIMELSDCKFLTEIPDLSQSSGLQELIIDKCTNLVEVHHSVGLLKNLVSLTISGCSKLKTLPRILKLTSLTVLVLEGCSMLQNFPEIGCKMEYLRSIDLRHTAVKELHPSIKYLIRLEELNLEGCKKLMNLPTSIHLLQHLKNLSLKDCSKLSKFPLQPPMNLSISNGGDSSIASLALQSLNLGNYILSKSDFFRSLNCSSTLEELDLSGCDFVSTTCIKRFVGLRRLILVDCKKLEEILELPPYIEEVNAGGCISLERFTEVSKRFEFNTCDLPRLVWADLSRCHKLLGNMENEVEKFLSIKGNLEDYICSIIFPENKIPNWFSHQIQTSNSDICEIDITEALCLDEEITGMILGAVIGITDEPQIPLPILCEVDIINGLSRHFEVKKFYLSGSDHLWLQYHIPKLNELKGDNVRVKFQIWYSTGLAFFKSCGVHLVHRYEEKTVDQMLNPQVQGGPLEDVDVHLDVPDEAWRARAGIRLASSALGASEVEPFTILSDEEGGDNRPLVRRRVSSLGAAQRAPAETSQAGPLVQDFEVRGSSLFDLRQTLAATQDRLDTALAEVESIQGRLKHFEAVLESEKSNAFCLGTKSLEKFLLVEENLENYIRSIIFSENKISNWFSCTKQTSDSNICIIDITEASHLHGEITGMALCAIIGLKEDPQIPVTISCTVQIINGYSRHFDSKEIHLSGSDHLWLLHHIPKFDDLKGDNVRVKFQIWQSTGSAFFKSCRVDMVYEEKAIDQMLNPQVRGVLLEDVDVHLEEADEAIENSANFVDDIQLTKRRREVHNYDDRCPRQKRHCGAFGIGVSGTDNIQGHQSTSLNPGISKGKIFTKDKVRVKAPRFRSSFQGCLGVGVGIGLRFKIFRRRRRAERKGIKSKISGIL